jgi:transcriptional regulator with XRE-family HTH domain
MARGGYPKINQFVGARIRERRVMLGMSQHDLGESIGLTTQQTIYKFEVGLDGVSASRLFEIAGALGTSVDYFFEGFEADAAGAQIPPRHRMLLSLMRSLGEIDSEEHLEAISHLIRALATP